MKNLLVILLLIDLFAVIAKGADPFSIKLNNSFPVQFCVDPVYVAKDLTIEGNPNIQGMKISFTQGYNAGEDELVYSGTKLISSNPTPGTLLLTGSTIIQDYIDAIRLITYKNSKSQPTVGIRKITISLDDVDYLPETGHFYRYISKPGISWTNASIEAASDPMVYYGLRGYLATITSKAENDFIKSKTTGVGWIGASDAAVEGEWRWVTGPEGLSGGLLFWKGTGYLAKTNPTNYGSVNGAYHNWNRWDTPYSASLAASTWEPNQSGEEDYAHITVFPGNLNDSYKWNDLPNAGGNGDYASKGYLIEWGGSAGEPLLNLTATLDLQVNTMLFKTGTISAICEGDTVRLNQPDSNTIPGTYSWTPAGSLSAPAIPNPLASPTITTSYTVIGTRGICVDSAHYIVPVNPKPVSLLKPEENICIGAQITLDPGSFNSYNWSNGGKNQTITVGTPGDYKVTLTTDKGCVGSSSSKVIVHEYPVIDLSKLDTLTCGDPRSTLVTITTNGNSYSLVSADGKAIINGLNVSAPTDGIYPIVYTSAIYPSCAVQKNFKLSFFKTPKVDFTVNAKKCSGYNLDVSYVGDADPARANFKWEFGGEVIANATGVSSLIVPLGINRSQRDLSLTVMQDGCSNNFVQKNILVIPNLDMKIVDSLGCEPFNAEFIAHNTEVVNYDWDFGDGSPVSRMDDHPFHVYQNSGFYNVKLKVTTIVSTGEGCTNEVKIDSMVHVAPIPDVLFSLSPGECLSPGVNEISYTGIIGTDRDKYYWDLTRFDPSEVILNPAQTKGPFRFDLMTQPQVSLGLKVISEFGCESALKNITIKRKPDFTIESDLFAGCIPFEPLLSGKIKESDKVDQVDFLWDFGDGSTGGGSPVSHLYDIADKRYTVTLSGKSTLTGCENRVVINDSVRTYPKPVAAFSMDNSIVYNDAPTVNFTNSSTGSTNWLWDFGDQLTSTAKNPSHDYHVTGYKTVLLDVSNEYNCNDTVSHHLLIAFDHIFPPNGFSPNAPDVIDRVFLLNSVGIIPGGYHFTVLSRWNDLVFEARNEIKGWDGRMKNGNWAPAGTYVWILDFTDFLGRKHRQSGSVTLVY